MASCPRSRAYGDPLAAPHRGELGLDRVGDLQVDPALGRVAVERQSTLRALVLAASSDLLVTYSAPGRLDCCLRRVRVFGAPTRPAVPVRPAAPNLGRAMSTLTPW